MRNFKVEIVNVTPPQFVKTAKGGYNVLEVAYKSDGKVTGKKLMDFASKAAFDLLLNAKQGEVFDVESEKNDKGYFDWIPALKDYEIVAGAAGNGLLLGKIPS